LLIRIHRKRLFWFGVALLVVGGGFLFSPPYAAYCESHQADNYYCATYKIVVALVQGAQIYSGFITALATIAIAWFTLTLKGSTDKLWKASDEQLRHARSEAQSAGFARTRELQHLEDQVLASRQIARAATRSANAAQLAAQASIQSQLPTLIVRSMGLYQPGQPHGANEPYTVKIEGGIPPEWSQVAIQIDNIGKTVAAAIEQCTEQCLGRRLPETPDYKTVIPMPIGEVIEPDGFVRLHVRNHFIHLLPQYRQQMEDPIQGLRLWIYGFVRYTDFMGKPHEFRFCKRWVVHQITGGASGFVSDSNNPAEYTHSY
jgi:hypothetical protein